MSTSGNPSNESVPCSNTGCHFWGRANTNGYCSKCFKELDGDASAAAAALTSKSSSSSIKVDSSSSSRPRSSSHRSSRRGSTSSKSSDKADSASKSESKSSSSESKAEAAGGAGEEGDAAPAKAVQKNKKRCWECRKKVGYTGIECRCGFVYCGTHRYPDSHKCEFNYKEFERGVLAKNNEKLENEKLGDRL